MGTVSENTSNTRWSVGLAHYRLRSSLSPYRYYGFVGLFVHYIPVSLFLLLFCCVLRYSHLFVLCVFYVGCRLIMFLFQLSSKLFRYVLLLVYAFYNRSFLHAHLYSVALFSSTLGIILRLVVCLPLILLITSVRLGSSAHLSSALIPYTIYVDF